jgi:hypothetical protein
MPSAPRMTFGAAKSAQSIYLQGVEDRAYNGGRNFAVWEFRVDAPLRTQWSGENDRPETLDDEGGSTRLPP